MIKRVAIGVLLSCVITSTSFAEGFVAVGAGSAKAAVDCTGFYACKDSSTGFKVSGGYMFSDRMGVEAVYLNMGKVTASGFVNVEFKTTGFGVGILGLTPLGTDWVFNYRIGLLSSKSTIETRFFALNGSKNSSTIYFGIGGGYNVNSNVTVALDYDRFNATAKDDQKYTVSLLSLAARYKF